VAGWGIEKGNGIGTTTDGEIYIVGGTNSSDCYFGQDSVHIDSLPSMFLAKIVNATPLSSEQIVKGSSHFYVYPNPSSTMFEVRSSVNGEIVELFNSVGQKYLHQK
jgi:hypothetical protein